MGPKLTDFKPKHVPGLYSYAHFEHENGAFVQARFGSEPHFVYWDADGERREFTSLADLKTHVEKE